MKNIDSLPLSDILLNKVYAYFQTIWSEKWKENIEVDWLSNFICFDKNIEEKEKINMLYLLSKFMYFGHEELRQLLLCLYRDMFKYPIVELIRKTNNDTTDILFINHIFSEELKATRFLGVGNPSESGVHLLYYFRQENNLPKDYFINTSDVFTTEVVSEELSDNTSYKYLQSSLKSNNIKRYIFIDDFCGSGSQAKDYLKDIVENIRFINPDIEVNYLMLFGTEYGITEVRKLEIFNRVEAVFTVDETFKAFSNNSRCFKAVPDPIIEKDFAKQTAIKYGNQLFNPPLGHGNCELLLGLFHNTPDNSLPIFWSERNNWKPVFKRYHKQY